MAEYIERYKAMDEINKWLDSVGNVVIGKGLSYYGELMGCLQDVPAADVAEVRHGKWEVVFDGNAKLYENMFECSVCKTTHVGHPSVGRYCPNCGAKMDLGDDEG